MTADELRPREPAARSAPGRGTLPSNPNTTSPCLATTT